MRTTALAVAAAAVALATGACKHAGTGPEVRADITARMQSIQEPLATCYAKALEANRKLRGVVVVDFTVKADTGEFTQLRVSRDEIGDPTVTQCVLEKMGTLKLATPQKTAVAASYPVDFAPAN